MISKEGGDVWERLILFLQCPFLALSATVGNPTEFESWLKEVEDAKQKASEGNNKLHLIKYEQRCVFSPEGAILSLPFSVPPSFQSSLESLCLLPIPIIIISSVLIVHCAHLYYCHLDGMIWS